MMTMVMMTMTLSCVWSNVWSRSGVMPMSAAGAAAPVTLPAARPARESYVLLAQGCSGAGTRWNAVPANILEPERRSGKYRWPQVER